ncbi:sensor domain-containing diguanylate cyclase [Rhizobium sp. C4]|uniref:sensor domain-containing diguanylate cyclase n=1 Tax=Rhizobium sp. C4 TaxID=1349800 RepID=UPI001E635A3B|nr:sensor domain-containing diguanylate cyclase [Rhizobium sp. C4]MCD2175609.1 GGDEF domain-containing protein [Rhizobium sp. C4]
MTQRQSTERSAVEALAGGLMGLQSVQSVELARLMTLGFDACAIPVALFAPDDTIAFANDAYRALMNVTADARTFGDVVRHAYRTGRGPVLSMEPEAWLAMASSRRRVREVRSFEVDFLDGSWYMVTESCLEGGWIWDFYTDITSLKSKEHTLLVARDSALRDADTDLLTGLHNRRYGVSELDHQIGVAARRGTNLAVVLIDLDHFKSINDTLGHSAGDDVLTHFAAEVTQLVRRGDTFARYGGEEFLLIMPGAGEREALAAMERARQTIEASAMQVLGHSYTFSSGVARMTARDDVKTLLRRADMALYAAKRAGRNCSQVAELPSP